MKKILLLFLCLGILNSFVSYAQDEFIGSTFTYSGAIPDDGTEYCWPLVITNIFPSTLDTIYGISNLCLDILHNETSELSIKLVSADGTEVIISDGLGNVGCSDFNNVCFDMDANFTIAGYLDCYNNTDFVPMGNLGDINNGSVGEYLWHLCITDNVVNNNNGVLSAWSVTLDNDVAEPTNGIIAPVCNTNITVGCECPDTVAQDCFLLPDIVITKNIMESMHTEYPGEITVATATANIGYGTIEFHGTNEWYCDGVQVPVGTICTDGSDPKQKIEQRIYKKSSTEVVDWIDVVAGYMQYHAAENHNHPHIDNWVHNSIRTKGPDESNPVSWPLISTGSKVSFCAMNGVQCSGPQISFCEYDGQYYDIDADLVNGRMGQFYTCNNVTQGVSVGYSDIYTQDFDGQEIFFSENICNGKYYLVSHFDPDTVFSEISNSNNVTYIPIYLSQQQSNCCVTNFDAAATGNACEYQFTDLTQPEANSWQWDFGDGNISNDQFPVHSFDTAGTYMVNLITENDSSCSNSYMKSITITCNNVAVEDFTFNENDIKISPNPFEENSTIYLTLDQNRKVGIEVYNYYQQKIKDLVVSKDLAGGQHSFQLSLKESGIYFVRININGTKILKKVIKI